MTVAIKRANNDLVWFDAVLSLNQTYAATVTKHPIEGGGVVSDHTTIDNPKMQISGVISDADFNLSRPNISNSDSEKYGLQKKQFVNNSPVVNTPIVTYSANKYAQFLPEAAQRFLGNDSPTVVVPSREVIVTSQYIKTLFVEMWREKEEFHVLEFDGDTISEVYERCIFTNVAFSENADSGEALYPNLSIEQVTYAISSNVKIPQKVAASLKNKVAPKTELGQQTTTKESVKTIDGEDGKSPLEVRNARDRLKNNNYPAKSTPKTP